MRYRVSVLVLVLLLGTGAVGAVTPPGAAPPRGASRTVSTAVDAATGLVGATTGRLAGADRYATAVQISRHRFPGPRAGQHRLPGTR